WAAGLKEARKAKRGRQRREGGSAFAAHLTPYKTKGHRVIAMPPCSAGLAPPAFTAPCRNQTSDCARLRGKRRACAFSAKNIDNAHRRVRIVVRLCHRDYKSAGVLAMRRGIAASASAAGDRSVRQASGDGDRGSKESGREPAMGLRADRKGGV